MITWGPVRRVVVVAVVVALVALGGLVVWVGQWRTHATLLDGQLGGAGFEMESRPVEKATLNVEMGFLEPDADADETVTFRSVDLQFAKNTANATARLSVCVPREPDGVIGAVGGSMKRYCKEIRPVADGTSIPWRRTGGLPEYFVLTIEPSRPGVATIDRIEIEYSRDGAPLEQRGKVSEDVHVTMRASR